MKKLVKETQKAPPLKEEPTLPDKDTFLIALEKGPTGVRRMYRTFESLHKEVVSKIYAEMIGQTLRQNRNIEQMAPAIAKASIAAADELIRALSTPDHPA